MHTDADSSSSANDSSLPEDPENSLQDVVEEFPSVRHAFAYGSGVFSQPGLYTSKTGERAMIDFIFVVEKPASWHYKNLERHRMHYSSAANLHSSLMTSLSDRLGAGVYFNPRVHMPQGMVIKYGVVGMDDVLCDLWTWDSLIVAGRLHKPVRHIVRDPAVMKAVAANLSAATAASLLLLPRDFSTMELLECLCGLSYRGDVRVGIAEDRDKVKRIVKGSFKALEELYRPHTKGDIANLAGLRHAGGGQWVQDTSISSRMMLLGSLPKAVQVELARSAGGWPSNSDAMHMLLKQRGAHDIVHTAISRIVRRSSLRQALLGGVTAGATRGFAYLAAKTRKRWQGA